MRYLLCAMLLAGLVACDDNAGSDGGATASNAPEAEHDHDHEQEHEHDHDHDEDRIAHFEGEESEDLAAAIANLQAYNQKLEAVLAKDQISRQELLDIHEWSYTLENAVGRLQTDLTTIAEHLEQVHLASERGETEQIREHGKAYLEGLSPLLEE